MNFKLGLSFFICLFSYNVESQFFNESLKILASDPYPNSQFGVTVDIKNDVLIVGAMRRNSAFLESGAAYIFENSNGFWIFKNKLSPYDPWTEDRFGYSVAIYDSVAVIGAPYKDDVGNESGAVYVYKRDAVEWNFVQKILPSDLESGDFFGADVAVYKSTIVIGSPGQDAAFQNLGSVYVFDYNGIEWTETIQFTGTNIDEEDNFGANIDIYDSTIVIGTHESDYIAIDAGCLHLFELNAGGWGETGFLTASDATAYDNFGYSVSVSGETVIAGAFGHDYNGSNSGCAYIFRKTGGVWVQEEQIIPSGVTSGAWFGFTVSIDNNIAVVGSNKMDPVNSVYIFEFDGNSWSEIGQVTGSDSEIGDNFGRDVSVSGDNLIVGALGNDDAGNHTGSAYIFGQYFLETIKNRSIGIRIYPNPASTEINITGISSGLVQVYDLTGRLVISENISATVDVSILDEGMYLFVISDSNGEVIKTQKQLIR